MVEKIDSKMHSVSCANTHHDVTDLANHGITWNTKTWIFWGRNRTFLWNKKILNLCYRWQILRSYSFVADATFKVKKTKKNGYNSLLYIVITLNQNQNDWIKLTLWSHYWKLSFHIIIPETSECKNTRSNLAISEKNEKQCQADNTARYTRAQRDIFR